MTDNTDERSAYYRTATTWSLDQLDGAKRSRRLAWIVAAVAAGVAGLEAVALVILMPLKTVEPYTLLVDRQTGFVEALEPLKASQVAGDAALTQSFLVQYVIARESFDFNALRANYKKVALWSAETARTEYLLLMQPSNTSGPLGRYGRDALVDTEVKSVSPIGPNTAMIRFETRRRDQAEPSKPSVAIVRYRYSGEPMRTEDRYLNPLGFQVVGYRVDAEALSSSEARAQDVASSEVGPTGVLEGGRGGADGEGAQ